MAESMLERLLRGGKSTSVGARAVDPSMCKKWPSLYELMTVVDMGDGKIRKPSSLLIFSEDGLWKGCLTERDLEISLWASAPGFLGVPDALEERLGQETIEWRRKPPRAQQRK